MKFKNIFKTGVICIFIILITVACHNIKPQNDYKIKDIEVNNSNTSNENINNAEWTFISRARFIQGTVVSIETSAHGKNVLNLKVEVNFHSGTDPVDNKDFPFKVGEVTTFILKSKPKININNKRIIIYEGQVTSNGKDDFVGADIKYYEDKGKFYDINGKEISLPPQDYPSSNVLSSNID